MENPDHILLFKTDIKTDADKLILQAVLNKEERIDKWNIDMNDVDCVLRVISCTMKHQHVIDIIKQHGYECCELT
jgi:hypothetical protein